MYILNIGPLLCWLPFKRFLDSIRIDKLVSFLCYVTIDPFIYFTSPSTSVVNFSPWYIPKELVHKEYPWGRMIGIRNKYLGKICPTFSIYQNSVIISPQNPFSEIFHGFKKCFSVMIVGVYWKKILRCLRTLDHKYKNPYQATFRTQSPRQLKTLA